MTDDQGQVQEPTRSQDASRYTVEGGWSRYTAAEGWVPGWAVIDTDQGAAVRWWADRQQADAHARDAELESER